MVSNARLDLPEPESPVTTVKRLRGNSTLTSFRLCCRAPRTVIFSIAIESQTLIDTNFAESRTLHCTRRVMGCSSTRRCNRNVSVRYARINPKGKRNVYLYLLPEERS